MLRSVVIAAAISLVIVVSAFGLASGRGISASAPTATSPFTGASTASHAQAPHSSPIPMGGAAPPLVISHWYAGSVLAPSVGTISAREVSTELTVPSANISSEKDQFYYVLLSVWDNIGSYDQIGIANSFGVWGFTYSFTDYCAQSYYFNPDYFNLAPGTTYTFSMQLANGFLTFYVFQGSTYIGGLSVITGATDFNVSTGYTCDSATYYDFTDYEEVYYTHQTTPDFSFQFAGTQVDGANAHMKGFIVGPAPHRVRVAVTQVTASTVIENEQFDLLYAGTSGLLVYLPDGTSAYSFTVMAGELNGKPALTSCQRTSSGWSFSGWSGARSPPFKSTQTLSINPSAPTGTYLEYLYAYNPASGHPACTGDYTFVTLEVILF